MQIVESRLRIGGEVDFGSYGEIGKTRFRLSLRYNKETGQYEFYKHFFKTVTSNEEPEEVMMASTDLTKVVREADKLATEFSGTEWKDETVLDLRIQDITIALNDMREELEYRLGRKSTDKELSEFVGYIERDVGQYITDNAKTFVREQINE